MIPVVALSRWILRARRKVTATVLSSIGHSPGHDVFWSKEKMESTRQTATEFLSGFTLLPVGRQSFDYFFTGILDKGSKIREISSVNLPKILRKSTALARVSSALRHLHILRVQSMCASSGLPPAFDKTSINIIIIVGLDVSSY